MPCPSMCGEKWRMEHTLRSPTGGEARATAKSLFESSIKGIVVIWRMLLGQEFSRFASDSIDAAVVLIGRTRPRTASWPSWQGPITTTALHNLAVTPVHLHFDELSWRKGEVVPASTRVDRFVHPKPFGCRRVHGPNQPSDGLKLVGRHDCRACLD